MKSIFLPLTVLILAFFSPAVLSAQDSHEGEEAPELFYNKIESNVEAFLGIAAPVANNGVHFHINLTDITTYKPILNGKVTVMIGSFATKESTTKDGVYHFGAKIEKAGEYKLTARADINGKIINFDFGTIKVYADLHEAIEDNEKPANKEEIILSKKYMWSTNFGVEVIKSESFDYVIETTGEILPSIASQAVVIAPISGVVSFSSKSLAGTKLEKGGVIATINSGSLESSLTARYERLKVEYESAKKNYERSESLFKDKIVSEKSYRESLNAYTSAKENYENLSRIYGKNGVLVKMPSTAVISQILVPEHQYVEAGTAIATIQHKTANMLKINIPKFDYKEIKYIYDANFKPEYLDKTLSIASIGGIKLSSDVSTATNVAYIPVYFSLPVSDDIIPHSFATVYAKVKGGNEAISVPNQALMENEGLYWVYIQVGGENFIKVDVTVGKNDGKRTLITSGLHSGDVVVTFGAVKVRQAENSGAPIDHGHSH